MSATKNKPAKEKKPGGVTGKGFMPGKSGNPGGRPKGESLTAILRRVLLEPDEDNPKDPERPELGTRKAAKLRIFSTCPYLIKTLPTLPVEPVDRAPKPGTYAHALRHDEVLRKDDEPRSLLSRGIKW